MRSLAQVFEDSRAESESDRVALVESIRHAVERLGLVSDDYVTIRTEYDLAKDSLARLVTEYDDRFSSDVELDNAKIWEGFTCRAIFKAVTKTSVLSVDQRELFASAGLDVFSPSMKKCREQLEKRDFDAL